MDQEITILQCNPWQKISFFHGLPLPLVKSLLEGSEIVDTAPRDVIFEQSIPATTFGFVLKGLFRLFRTNNRKHRVIMDFVEPGGMIGALLMANPVSVYPVTVQSVGRGQFLKIPQATFQRFWLSDPEVMRRTQISQLERMQGMQTIREWQKLNLEEKIASLFERWQKSGDPIIRLPRADIADTVGASTEAVIRILSVWENRGLLTKIGVGTLKVTTPNLLSEVQCVSRKDK